MFIVFDFTIQKQTKQHQVKLDGIYYISEKIKLVYPYIIYISLYSFSLKQSALRKKKPTFK